MATAMMNQAFLMKAFESLSTDVTLRAMTAYGRTTDLIHRSLSTSLQAAALTGVLLVVLRTTWRATKLVFFRSPVGEVVGIRDFFVDKVVRQFAERWAKNPPRSGRTLRDQFMRTPLRIPRPADRHSHPTAAAARNAAAMFAEEFAALCGLGLFIYQASAADVRRGRDGSTAHRWVVDTKTPARRKDAPRDGVLYLANVDYYVDMNEILAERTGPTLLYTYVPRVAAYSTGETSATFDANNELVMHISGGATYRHRLWDYCTDAGTAWTHVGLGITSRGVAYTVDRRDVDQNYQLVFICPTACYEGLLAATAARATLADGQLQRLTPVQGDYIRLMVTGPTGAVVSTAMVGQFTSTTITAEQDAQLAAGVEATHSTYTTAQVKQVTGLTGPDNAVLAAYHRTRPRRRPAMVPSVPVGQAVLPFTNDLGSYDPQDKPVIKSYMQPFVHGAYAPMRNAAAEAAAVGGRIEKVRRTEEMGAFTMQCARDFISIFPAGVVEPVDVEEVFAKQSTPSQRRILEEGALAEPLGGGTFFVKAEAYGKPTDPRIINQVLPGYKLRWSQYTYGYAALMKEHEWYGFGRPNAEVAARMVELAEKYDVLFEHDGSRWDGHLSPAGRTLERMFIARVTSTQHVDDALELHAKGYGNDVRGRYGTVYNQGTTRASGNPETSLFNSLIGAFIGYLGARRTRHADGRFLGHEEALARLGVYGGDDAVNTVGGTPLLKAAADMGQDFTEVVHQRGSPGLVFLGRVFGPDLWNGDDNSCCQLKRTIAKFHTSVENDAPLRKLLEKSRAYNLTDGHTPILGPFTSKVLELAGALVDDVGVTRDTPWNVRRGPEGIWPNRPAEWMLDELYRDLPDIDVALFDRWLASITTLEELLTPPLLVPVLDVQPPQEFVVDGEVVGEELPTPVGSTQVEGANPAQGPPGAVDPVPAGAGEPATDAAREERTRRTRRGRRKPRNPRPQAV